MQVNKAIYLGTFDPLTNGHCDVISRASRIFENIVVGVGNNKQKQDLFSQQERVKIIEEYTKKLPGVKVKCFSGLTVDFATKENSTIIIRGVRTEADYTYEMQMAMMNKSLMQDLETIFIPTQQGYSHISSTLVKEVALLGGDVATMVPAHVIKFLQEKIFRR